MIHCEKNIDRIAAWKVLLSVMYGLNFGFGYYNVTEKFNKSNNPITEETIVLTKIDKYNAQVPLSYSVNRHDSFEDDGGNKNVVSIDIGSTDCRIGIRRKDKDGAECETINSQCGKVFSSLTKRKNVLDAIGGNAPYYFENVSYDDQMLLSNFFLDTGSYGKGKSFRQLFDDQDRSSVIDEAWLASLARLVYSISCRLNDVKDIEKIVISVNEGTFRPEKFVILQESLRDALTSSGSISKDCQIFFAPSLDADACHQLINNSRHYKDKKDDVLLLDTSYNGLISGVLRYRDNKWNLEDRGFDPEISGREIDRMLANDILTKLCEEISSNPSLLKATGLGIILANGCRTLNDDNESLNTILHYIKDNNRDLNFNEDDIKSYFDFLDANINPDEFLGFLTGDSNIDNLKHKVSIKPEKRKKINLLLAKFLFKIDPLKKALSEMRDNRTPIASFELELSSDDTVNISYSLDDLTNALCKKDGPISKFSTIFDGYKKRFGMENIAVMGGQRRFVLINNLTNPIAPTNSAKPAVPVVSSTINECSTAYGAVFMPIKSGPFSPAGFYYYEFTANKNEFIDLVSHIITRLSKVKTDDLHNEDQYNTFVEQYRSINNKVRTSVPVPHPINSGSSVRRISSDSPIIDLIVNCVIKTYQLKQLFYNLEEDKKDSIFLAYKRFYSDLQKIINYYIVEQMLNGGDDITYTSPTDAGDGQKIDFDYKFSRADCRDNPSDNGISVDIGSSNIVMAVLVDGSAKIVENINGEKSGKNNYYPKNSQSSSFMRGCILYATILDHDVAEENCVSLKDVIYDKKDGLRYVDRFVKSVHNLSKNVNDTWHEHDYISLSKLANNISNIIRSRDDVKIAKYLSLTVNAAQLDVRRLTMIAYAIKKALVRDGLLVEDADVYFVPSQNAIASYYAYEQQSNMDKKNTYVVDLGVSGLSVTKLEVKDGKKYVVRNSDVTDGVSGSLMAEIIVKDMIQKFKEDKSAAFYSEHFDWFLGNDCKLLDSSNRSKKMVLRCIKDNEEFRKSIDLCKIFDFKKDEYKNTINHILESGQVDNMSGDVLDRITIKAEVLSKANRCFLKFCQKMDMEREKLSAQQADYVLLSPDIEGDGDFEYFVSRLNDALNREFVNKYEEFLTNAFKKYKQENFDVVITGGALRTPLLQTILRKVKNKFVKDEPELQRVIDMENSAALGALHSISHNELSGDVAVYKIGDAPEIVRNWYDIIDNLAVTRASMMSRLSLLRNRIEKFVYDIQRNFSINVCYTNWKKKLSRAKLCDDKGVLMFSEVEECINDIRKSLDKTHTQLLDNKLDDDKTAECSCEFNKSINEFQEEYKQLFSDYISFASHIEECRPNLKKININV